MLSCRASISLLLFDTQRLYEEEAGGPPPPLHSTPLTICTLSYEWQRYFVGEEISVKILSHPVHCLSLLAWETDIRDLGKDLSTHARQKFSSDQCELEHTAFGKVYAIHATVFGQRKVVATRKVIPQWLPSLPTLAIHPLNCRVLKAIRTDYFINMDHKRWWCRCLCTTQQRLIQMSVTYEQHFTSMSYIISNEDVTKYILCGLVPATGNI